MWAILFWNSGPRTFGKRKFRLEELLLSRRDDTRRTMQAKETDAAVGLSSVCRQRKAAPGTWHSAAALCGPGLAFAQKNLELERL